MVQISLVLVQTVTVGSGGAASIEFTGIPQDGTDLLILLSGRQSTTSQAVKVQPNGASTNLSARILAGTGSSSFSTTDTAVAALTAQSVYTADTFGNSTIYISNYTSSSSKSITTDSVNENNATLAFQYLVAGLWDNSAAITSLELVSISGNLVEHSTASLYKITKA